MQSPINEQPYEDGICHLNFPLLNGIHDELKEFQADVLSKELEDTFQYWCDEDAGCICGSIDDTHSDEEDFTYCLPDDEDDGPEYRTFRPLELILPALQATLDKLSKLIFKVANEAEVSRTRYERKQALVAQWAAQLDEETDSEGQSESTMELDYQLPEASNADTVEDNLPSDDTAMARCGNVITDLPAELLSGIILLAHGKDARAPLVFSQINTSCREFSINTPILWSVIDILHPRNLTTLYLARSLGVPLEVRMIPIPSMVEPGGDATERLNQFISSLFPHQDRIRSLRMSFDRLPFATTAMSFLTNNNLRSLEILDFGGFGHLEDTTIIPDGGGLVSGWALRVLTIHGVRIDPESRFFPPTLTSLRLCGTSGFTITQLSQILLRTPALRFLCFDSFRLDDRDGFPCETIAALNHLTELRFDLVGDKYMDKIITHINTPQLHTLAVRPRFDLNITTSPSPDMEDSDWEAILQNLPELRRLRIASCYLLDTELAPLHDNPSHICPQLEHLIIENNSEMHPDLNTAYIRCLVETRRGGTTARLRTVTLRGWDALRVDEGDVVALREMLDQFVLECYAPEVDQGYPDTASSEGSDWADSDDSD